MGMIEEIEENIITTKARRFLMDKYIMAPLKESKLDHAPY